MAMKKSKQGGNAKSSPTWIWFAVALAIGYGFWRFQSKRPPSLAAEPPAGETSRESPGIEILPDKAASPEPKAKAMSVVDVERLGLKGLELKGNGPLNIRLNLTSEKKWCRGGDLDTIRFATLNPKVKDLLVSLEPLTEGEDGPDPVPVSLDDLMKGTSVSFKLDRPKRPESYGLYICSNFKRQSQARCKAVKLQTHEEMATVLAQNPQTKGKIDYIFYFQHFIVHNRGLDSHRSDLFSQGFEKYLKGYFDKQKLDKRAVQKAWSTTQKLKSNQAVFKNEVIQLSLPYNDPRCFEAARMPPKK